MLVHGMNGVHDGALFVCGGRNVHERQCDCVC